MVESLWARSPLKWPTRKWHTLKKLSENVVENVAEQEQRKHRKRPPETT